MFRFLIRFFPRLVKDAQLSDVVRNMDKYSERVQLLSFKEVIRRAEKREVYL